MTILDYVFYANPVRAWLLALLVAGAAFAGLQIARGLLLRQLQRLARRTRNAVDDVLADALRATRVWFLVLVSLWAGSLLLVLPETIREVASTVAVLVILVQMGIWGATAVASYVRSYSAVKIEEDAASVTTMRALGFLATVALWSVIVLVGLDNLGIDITALVAGLGVGGVAVALAVQSILGDLFASLSIVLDKPFVYGDFIVVGDLMGTVEHVGLKTTRVRSLSGEQLVFSNSDLLGSRIRNFKRMQERRVLFSLGVVYQTPRRMLERIPEMIREAVEAQPDTRFDRAHFKAFGASSLDFEVVYYVGSPDFNLYMDRQQAINLEIVRRFEEDGIEFAYPTQTLFVQGADAGQPLAVATA
jgi:small-conductance mechanosensitive channel